MDLKSTLRRFLPQESNKPTPANKQKVDLNPILHGIEVATPFGACYVVEKTYPLDYKHGNCRVGSALQVANTDNLALLGKVNQGKLDLSKTLFLDTETTGLAGGTGTYAFLVGIGRFSDTHFIVKQFLMRDYNEELALLYLLDQELQNSHNLVSFNGKTFDIPLLKTRYTLSRLELSGIAGKKQIDLLHLSRRLWRRKLASCSLGSLEEHILGLTRHGDIPGYEIPQRYFQFLQTGDGTLLQDIMEHNVIDIISMATLLYQLHFVVDFSPEDCTCPWEAESLAQVYATNGKLEDALQYIDAAMYLSDNTEHEIRLLRLGALINKRLKRYNTAATLWQKLLQNSPDDLMAYEELAKHYEHRMRDLVAADQVTRRALAIAWQTRSPKVKDLEHRLRRIGNKSGAVV